LAIVVVFPTPFTPVNTIVTGLSASSIRVSKSNCPTPITSRRAS